MLEIGNGNQNHTEYETQFSLWCIAKAPLLLGCDLSNAKVQNGTAADAFSIFLNSEAIAISQDDLAVPASQVDSTLLSCFCYYVFFHNDIQRLCHF